ncbi:MULTISPECIES: hypothetical protein [unclassified Microbacterium]|uniref:hypothetical protein n=1 Tax=unclassified Microbacterium TaxID=2609290 RepID=UPI0034666988
MHRSTLTARLITSVISLVLTPIALILLSVGGQTMILTFFAYAGDGDLASLTGPVLLQILGLALLILVVLTGVWSSAGLIAIGIFSIVPLIVAVFPVTLSWIYGIAPREWVDGFVYGLPLVVLAALGAMGLVLALVRRDPRPKGAALGVVGLIVAPLLLAAGAWSITWGIAEGTLFALQRFEFDVRPGPGFAVVAGALLVIAGITVTRWSRFALVVPALVLLVGSILLVVARDAVMPALFELPRGMNTVAPSLLLYGGGAAAGLIYLTFTAVLLRVVAHARSAGAPGAPGAPGATTPDTTVHAQYPHAQYPQAQYPPAPMQHPYPPVPGQQPPSAPYPPQPGP